MTTWKVALILFVKRAQKLSFNSSCLICWIQITVVILFINGNSQVIDTLNTRANDSISISIITYAELLYMSEKSEKVLENRRAVEAFLTSVNLYFIDEETALIYSQLKASIFASLCPKR